MVILFQKTMPIVLVEKFNDALAAITIVSIFTLVNNMLEIQILMIFLSLIVISVYFIIRYERIFNNIINKIAKIRFLKKFASNIFESKETLQILSKRKIILKSWGISLIAWSFDAIGIYFSFQAFNLDFNIIVTTSIAFSAIIIGAISFIPAGIGLIETSLIGLLLLREVDLATASSLTLLIRFTTYWFATFLGIVAIRFFLKKSKNH